MYVGYGVGVGVGAGAASWTGGSFFGQPRSERGMAANRATTATRFMAETVPDFVSGGRECDT